MTALLWNISKNAIKNEILLFTIEMAILKFSCKSSRKIKLFLSDEQFNNVHVKNEKKK